MMKKNTKNGEKRDTALTLGGNFAAKTAEGDSSAGTLFPTLFCPCTLLRCDYVFHGDKSEIMAKSGK